MAEKRSFSITLDDEQWAFVSGYQEKMGYQTMAETVREMIRHSMTQNIEMAVAIQARKEARHQFLNWAFGHMRRTIDQMNKEMKEHERTGF